MLAVKPLTHPRLTLYPGVLKNVLFRTPGDISSSFSWLPKPAMENENVPFGFISTDVKTAGNGARL